MIENDSKKLKSIDSEVEEEVQSSENLMEKPFNPTEIRIVNKPLTIDLLIKRLQANPIEIDMEPAFQRKSDLWDQTKQSLLIESLLIKFPLPAFYFDGSDDNCWLVVDGLQRLSTLYNFVIKKTLKLQNLEFLKKLEGTGFDGLPRNLQRQIEEAQVIAYIINPGTPEEVKFNIFKRINTGGLTLNSQEIRHAMNQGIPANYVADLAGSVSFKNTTGFYEESPRMIDREFVTRFIAFYQFGYQSYTPDLDKFLNDAMKVLKTLSVSEKEKMSHDFEEGMRLSSDVFGEYAFRKLDDFPKRKPLNKALFEVWSVLFAKLDSGKREGVRLHKDQLIASAKELMQNDQKFIDSVTVSTGSKNSVLERFSKVDLLINQFLK